MGSLAVTATARDKAGHQTASTATATVTTPPAPLWTCDYSGTLASKFYVNTGSYNPLAAQIVSAPVPPNGGKCGSYAVPAGGQRCEDIPLGYGYSELPYVEGLDHWWGASYYLDAAHPINSPYFQVLTQWKNDGTGSPPIEFTIGQNSGLFRMEGGWGNPTGPKLTSRDMGPVIRGRWFRFVAHIYFSSDPAKALVEAWLDGVQVVAGYRPAGGTLYPGMKSYQKLGYYRDSSGFTTAHGYGQNAVCIANPAIGTSYAAVA
jgi:hypothetical protein